MGTVWRNISVTSELPVGLFVFKFLTIYSSEIMREDALFMKAHLPKQVFGCQT